MSPTPAPIGLALQGHGLGTVLTGAGAGAGAMGNLSEAKQLGAGHEKVAQCCALRRIEGTNKLMLRNKI